MRSPQLHKFFLDLSSAPVVAERYYILYPLKWEGMKLFSLAAWKGLFSFGFSLEGKGGENLHENKIQKKLPKKENVF